MYECLRVLLIHVRILTPMDAQNRPYSYEHVREIKIEPATYEHLREIKTEPADF